MARHHRPRRTAVAPLVGILALAAALAPTASARLATAGGDATVVFVDVQLGVDQPGAGSAEQPYRTLTFALGQESHPIENDPPLELRLAAGTYSPGNGEVLPIQLVPGTAIVGVDDPPFGAGTVVRAIQGVLNEDPIFDATQSTSAISGGWIRLANLEIVTGTRVPVEAELPAGSLAPLNLELDTVRVRNETDGPLLLPERAVDYWVRTGSHATLPDGLDFPAGELILRNCRFRAAGNAVRARVESGRGRVGVEGGAFTSVISASLLAVAKGGQRELVLDLIGARIHDAKTGLESRSLGGGKVTATIRRTNFVGNGYACDQTLDILTGEVETVPRGAIQDSGQPAGNVTYSIEDSVFFRNGLALCPKHYDLISYRAGDYQLADNVYSVIETFTAGTGVVASPGFVGESVTALAQNYGPAVYDMHLHFGAAARDLGGATDGTSAATWIDADGQGSDDPCGDGVPDAGLDEWREAIYPFPRLILGEQAEIRLLGQPGRLAAFASGTPLSADRGPCPTIPAIAATGHLYGTAVLDEIGLGRVKLQLGESVNPSLIGLTVHLQGATFDPRSGALDFTPVRSALLHGQ